MDRVEQRNGLKALFLNGLRYKVAHMELCFVLGEQADSLSHMKQRVRRFKDGDLSYEDEAQSRRLPSDLTNGIHRRLEKFPFTSTKGLAKHFGGSLPTNRPSPKNASGTMKMLKNMRPS
jgi:hypothetical protein